MRNPTTKLNRMTQRVYYVFAGLVVLSIVSFIFRTTQFVSQVFYVVYFATGVILGVIITTRVIIMMTQNGVEGDLMPAIHETMMKYFPEIAESTEYQSLASVAGIPKSVDSENKKDEAKANT